MAQVNMSLRIDAELKDAFMAAAKSMDRNGSQLIRDFMRQTVERQHNTWFRDQVEAGRQQLERGDAIKLKDNFNIVGRLSYGKENFITMSHTKSELIGIQRRYQIKN